MEYSLLNVSQLVSAIVLLILSFLVIAPLSVALKNFGGECFLSSQVEGDNDKLYMKQWGHRSQCVYPEFMGFVALFYSIGYIIWSGCLLLRNVESRWLESLISCVGAGLCTFMTLVSSSVLSNGIDVLCTNINHLSSPSCEVLNIDDTTTFYYRWDTHLSSTVKTLMFLTYFRMAEVCSWLIFITFLVLTIVYAIKYYSVNRADGFRENLARERERITTQSSEQRRYDQI